MDKFKVLEYIKYNLDKDNYIESFAKFALYLEENGIVLSEEDISYLINNVPVIRYMLDNSLKDDKDIETNSLLSSFLDVYFSLDDEKYYRADTNYLNVYLREISVYPRLSKEDEYNLGKKIQAGDKEARDTLILHNLRLSVSVAKRYLYTNISLRDLIEEGNMGLIHAAESFNPDRGVKFSTYAVICIKKAILRSIPKCYTDITMSDNAFSKYRAYGYVVNKYITEKGEWPTDKEVAKILNTTLEEVLEIKTYNPNAASLESFYEGEDNKGNELLFVKDDIDDEIDDIMRATDVKELIDTLDEREQDILKKRYGLYDGVCYTLDEIARDYHVTRERIRKIVETSLKRLRNSKKSAKFEGEYPSSRVKRL